MLIRFNVKNFLSFNETDEGKSIEFSMIAGKSTRKNEHIYNDGKIKLLKLATIYGANASGKSNLVKALDFTSEVILNGSFPIGSYNKYCKILEENKKLASYFEFEIKIEDRYFAYGFEAILSKEEFVSEWLVELFPSGKEKVIFERNIEKAEIYFDSTIKNDSNVSAKLKLLEGVFTRGRSILFLNFINKNEIIFDENKNNTSINILGNIYEWVKNNLVVNNPDKPISNYEYLSNVNNLEKICKIISSFGTGITNLHIREIPLRKVMESLPYEFQQRLYSDIDELKSISDKSKNDSVITIRTDDYFFTVNVYNKKVTCKTVQFRHEKENVYFELSEESDGTIRILDLIEILLSESGKTYIIDELDRCLHPCLTRRFIELFLQIAEKKNIQLIVTTHESRLLDFNLLRRDEIWFLNKKDNGESEIYSLEEYNERFDKKIDKAYLEGRYKGVPIFDILFPINDVN